mmetsp:Transcript_19586/g.58063  ORF Transcript_19586/g.58063 Transcript_19586/m.58063 type:complete len:538 (+) Transcript_19586:855-2468(+)
MNIYMQSGVNSRADGHVPEQAARRAKRLQQIPTHGPRQFRRPPSASLEHELAVFWANSNPRTQVGCRWHPLSGAVGGQLPTALESDLRPTAALVRLAQERCLRKNAACPSGDRHLPVGAASALRVDRDAILEGPAVILLLAVRPYSPSILRLSPPQANGTHVLPVRLHRVGRAEGAHMASRAGGAPMAATGMQGRLSAPAATPHRCANTGLAAVMRLSALCSDAVASRLVRLLLGLWRKRAATAPPGSTCSSCSCSSESGTTRRVPSPSGPAVPPRIPPAGALPVPPQHLGRQQPKRPQGPPRRCRHAMPTMKPSRMPPITLGHTIACSDGAERSSSMRMMVWVTPLTRVLPPVAPVVFGNESGRPTRSSIMSSAPKSSESPSGDAASLAATAAAADHARPRVALRAIGTLHMTCSLYSDSPVCATPDSSMAAGVMPKMAAVSAATSVRRMLAGGPSMPVFPADSASTESNGAVSVSPNRTTTNSRPPVPDTGSSFLRLLSSRPSRSSCAGQLVAPSARLVVPSGQMLHHCEPGDGA